MKPKSEKIIPSLVCGALLSVSSVMAQSFIGQWDFNSGNLAATSGSDLMYADFVGGPTSQATTFGSTTTFGIPNIAGTAADVMGFAANINGMGYLMPLSPAANGGGSLVNEYTLVFDLFYPTASDGQIRPLADTDYSFGLSPGPEFVISADNGIGVAGGASFGAISGGTWNRLAIVNTPAEVRFFVNGTKVGTALGGGVDGRFAATPSDNLLLLGSTLANAAPGFVNSIQFRDVALSDGQVIALGSASASDIPQVIPPVPSYLEEWIPAGTIATRSTPIGVVINRGETTIDTGTITLKLDNTAVSQPQITQSGSLITVSKAGLPLLSPGSTHTIEVAYTDSIAGAKTFTRTFKAALLFEDFEGLELQDSVEELAGTPEVWTPVPPPGWTVDNSQMPGYGDPETDGRTEWAGWSFAKKSFWIAADNQTRDQFTLGTGVIAIADPDEWDDASHPQQDENGNSIYFNSFLTTPTLDLTGVGPDTVFVKFDSSWRPEGFDDWGGSNNMTATVTVTYNGTEEVEILRWDSQEGGPFFHPDSQNEPVFIRVNNPAGATNMLVTFALTKGANDWWWAFDNLEINAGSVAPLITSQPESQFAYTGSTVEFSVAASGTEPLQYNWYFNDALVANATASTLSLPDAQTDDLGNYYVVISNDAGSITSSIVSLTLFGGEITDDLVTHLKFDGGYTDASGRGNNASAAGAPTFENGIIGQAVRINSASSLDPNNYVTMGYPDDLKFGSGDTATDFSISLWARVTSHSGDKPFASNKDWDSGSNRGFVISSLDNGMKWNYRDDQSARRDSPSVGAQLNDGDWHHLTVTFDRSDLARVYVDGQLLNSTSIAPDPGQPIGSVDTDDLGNSFNFGQDGVGDYGSSIEMLLDDIGVWRRLLTPQEVAAIYNAGLQSNDLTQAQVGASAIPPAFTQEPEDASGYERDLIALNSAATGSPPLSYQWYFGNAPIAGATNPEYSIPSLMASHAGNYFVVVQNDGGSITSRVATVTYLGASAPPQVTGQWDFNAGNLTATVGAALTPFDATVEADTDFGTTTSFGIPDIAGAPASVLYYTPSAQPWGGYVMPHGAQPNAGGAYVNRFSIIYDVLYPASSGGTWRALLQTSEGNANDGDLFVNAADGVGISGNYSGTVPTDAWTRIVAVFDLPSNTLKKYIDGELVGTQTLSSGLDGRWSLGATALLFADEDGETNPGYVNSIQFRSGAMTDAEVAALGGVTTDGIPGIPSSPSISDISLQGSSIVISWDGQPGLKLQRNSSLATDGWADVPGTEGGSTATLPVEGQAGFFRLAQ